MPAVRYVFFKNVHTSLCKQHSIDTASANSIPLTQLCSAELTLYICFKYGLQDPVNPSYRCGNDVQSTVHSFPLVTLMKNI